MNPLISEIKEAVREYYGLTEEQFLNPSSARRYSGPRQVAMWFASWMTDKSYPQIGKAFGRDHTTVIHARKAVEARRSGLVDDIRAIKALIERAVERRDIYRAPIASIGIEA